MISGAGAALRWLPGRLSEKYDTFAVSTPTGVFSLLGGGGADFDRFTGVDAMDSLEFLDVVLVAPPCHDCLEKPPWNVCAIGAIDGRAVWGSGSGVAPRKNFTFCLTSA